jgi:GNAT superfamily N-acetyltransferase
MPTPDIQIVIPADPESLEITRGIFREYVGSLDIDQRLQDIEEELAALPGEYAPPHGHLLLAFVDGELAGCGALRALTDVDYANSCEMKRLYVRPAFRRFGLGRLLAQALFDEARSVGYSTMLLDTLDDMGAARGLYASLGFEEIAPYYYSPIAGSHYLKADLD